MLTNKEENCVPSVVICSKALEEIIEHTARCGKVLPSLNERRIFKLQREIQGKYRATLCDWYAITNETETAIPYLLAHTPISMLPAPLKGTPACAECGSISDIIEPVTSISTQDGVVAQEALVDDLHIARLSDRRRQQAKRKATYGIRKSNYILEKSVKSGHLFRESSKYLTPLYVTVISAHLVVLFRVSHTTANGPNGTLILIPPARIVFACDWWSRNKRYPSTTAVDKERDDAAFNVRFPANRSDELNKGPGDRFNQLCSVFKQYKKLIDAASKDGFICADSTPFNMLVLLPDINQYHIPQNESNFEPKLVWPACLTWYFSDDKHIVQPSTLNTLDSCCFALYVFRKVPCLGSGNGKSLASKSMFSRFNKHATSNSALLQPEKDSSRMPYLRDRKKTYKAKFVTARSVANSSSFSQDFADLYKRADSKLLEFESIESMLMLERCASVSRALCLLGVKCIAINHVAQVSLSMVSFFVGGFAEIARKPSAIAMSDSTRVYCLDKQTPCNLRHVFVAINEACSVYDILHRFVCVRATTCTENITNAPNVNDVFNEIEAFLDSSEMKLIITGVVEAITPRKV